MQEWIGFGLTLNSHAGIARVRPVLVGHMDLIFATVVTGDVFNGKYWCAAHSDDVETAIRGEIFALKLETEGNYSKDRKKKSPCV